MCSSSLYHYCKAKILCIILVNYGDKYTEMHDQQNVEKCNSSYIRRDLPENGAISAETCKKVLIKIHEFYCVCAFC